ncbi:GIY-YIG nuclease family protein [Henriciella sp.]|uniref:GIY-YIG nuclease family protein n=1 Tax=Henriciella sp. TaxID=1968823 RepID=UPI0026227F99|nr:hypothetical protein [Henriciella sp.]
MNTADIGKALRKARKSWSPELSHADGFYGIYLKPYRWLPRVSLPQEGLLFVGNTHSGNTLREHFAPSAGDSMASCLRQSLGALLADQLELTAEAGTKLPRLFRPRAPYRFDLESERRLDAWMKENLDCAFIPFRGDACAVSWILISDLEPALNLSGWRNPQAAHIRRLQRRCSGKPSVFDLARSEAA